MREVAQAEERRSDARKEPKWVWRTSSLRGARLGTEFVGGGSLARSPIRCEYRRQTGRQHLTVPWCVVSRRLLSRDDFQPQHLDTTFPMRDEHVILLRVESQLHDGFFEKSSLCTLPVHLVAKSF